MSAAAVGEPDSVLLERFDDRTALITLNRPAQRNAMNRAARRGLLRALDACRDGTRVVVITGAGPAFCSGIDLKEAVAPDASRADTADERLLSWRSVQNELRAHPAIIVAAVNGTAMGGGVTLINAAELAIAADDATIALPELGFGIYPSLAGPSTQLNLPPKLAAWMVLTAEGIDGSTAARWGLVNLAVPRDEVVPRAMELAATVARHDPIALAAAKTALREVPARLSGWADALEYGETVTANIRARRRRSAQGPSAMQEYVSGLGAEKQAEPKP